ncbi:hypothetical protein M885DRAFT_82760 [Pelagophyceae sp. CCMP2097]|nr:hypothetical protein M885DRAFT_82760 [Pelagophyceae sp. CCMP2097]
MAVAGHAAGGDDGEAASPPTHVEGGGGEAVAAPEAAVQSDARTLAADVPQSTSGALLERSPLSDALLERSPLSDRIYAPCAEAWIEDEDDEAMTLHALAKRASGGLEGRARRHIEELAYYDALEARNTHEIRLNLERKRLGAELAELGLSCDAADLETLVEANLPLGDGDEAASEVADAARGRSPATPELPLAGARSSHTRRLVSIVSETFGASQKVAADASCTAQTGSQQQQQHAALYRCFSWQTYEERELVVIDRAPSPSTFLTSAAERDDRVRYTHGTRSTACTAPLGRPL